MRRSKSSDSLSARKWKLPRLLLLLAAALYLLFVSFKFRHLLHLASASASTTLDRPALRHDAALRRDLEAVRAPPRRTPPATRDDPLVLRSRPEKPLRPFRHRYGRIPAEILRRGRSSASWAGNVSELEHMAHEAWALGQKAWADLASPSSNLSTSPSPILDPNPNPCPTSLSGQKVGSFGDQVMFLPCGLEVGSSITVIGTPEKAHSEYVAQLAKTGNGMVMVSQFIVELQGLKAVDGEDPPRILHFNPRIKGDWSKKPVIELNTCYRMQWGKAMRCDGETAKDDDETVDGLSKCEKWVQSDTVDSKESKTTSWLNRFIGRAKKPEISWPFPFVEGKLFVLTLRAGVEGYHIYVGGRHVISFPYRTGFALEDATGLAIKGNVDVHSVYATSLPKSHPSFSLLHVLEMSEEWKSPPLPEKPIHVFVGILSATNHFAERMAIRKTWMQYPAIRSSNVVARFFVALSPNKEVNAILKKEAEYFGDIVILPFMDRYELVVLKTLAICEFGVLNMTADYIMKCDDDTFVRLDVILREIDSLGQWRSLYMGNLNLLVRPLRSGKWAVTYEEWPEEIYPPYANGPGYIISNDIARFIVSKHANQTLRLFKMEDVSMGMWVEEFNAANNVKYSHSWKFCQYGCMENYYTAHYQSPRQMICLWDKLARGRAQCCNFR